MTIKNVIPENRIPVNKYALIVQPGIGEITLTSIGGLEEELDAPELPDRTVRSGGRAKPGETDIVQPMHITEEVALMEGWYALCKLALPGYLKNGVLVQFDESGRFPVKRWTLPNSWLKKRAHSDSELDNDGEMSTITWTLSYDEIRPA